MMRSTVVGFVLWLTACAHAEIPLNTSSGASWRHIMPAAPAGPQNRLRYSSGPQIQEIRTVTPSISFSWPLAESAVTSSFGSRQDPLHRQRNAFHYGVDLGASYGAVVRAAAAGRVLTAGWHRGHGRWVCLAHTGHFTSCYAHLSQVIAIPRAYVAAGAPLGLVGNSGRSTGAHLHVEITHDGNYLDPLAVLGETISIE